MTSISAPTSDVKALCALTGWQTVVVADKKTPADWSWPGCHFLSLAQQEACYPDFRLPYNSYTRKNFGHLFAIEHGARTIYSTDDDNAPRSTPAFVDVAWGLKSTALAANPYAVFGRGDLWARGYVLDWLNESTTVAAGPMPRVGVQQGLADMDPDLDAIGRLTHRHELGKIYFAPESVAVAVPLGLLAPFNSQATLWTHDAFWGLYLPTSVSFRYCDIIRGYWAQRILWELRLGLVFTGPTVDQVRNPHDLVADLHDEEQMYRDGAALVSFLSQWRSQREQTDLARIIVDLSDAMVAGGLWAEEIRPWLAALDKAGYRMPDLVK